MTPQQWAGVLTPIVAGAAAIVLPHLSSSTVAVVGTVTLIAVTVAKAVHNVFVPTEPLAARKVPDK